MMEIDVGALRQERGRTLEREFLLRDAGLDYRGDRYRVGRPARVRARLVNTGKAVRAEVAGHLDLECTCDRCLDPFSFGVDVAYAEEFLTPAQAVRAGVEGGGSDDGHVRRTVVQADLVSLDEGFWQAVILSLPMKRLCRPDCRGICPRCGRNRNHDRCACPEREADPRLAALERLMRGES
jgi:uncharacterized protein